MNGTGEEHRNALMGKAWARRTVHVHGVTPSGDAVFEAVDDMGREAPPARGLAGVRYYYGGCSCGTESLHGLD